MGDHFSRCLHFFCEALGHGKGVRPPRLLERKGAARQPNMMLIGPDLFIVSFYWRKALTEAMSGSRSARQALRN